MSKILPQEQFIEPEIDECRRDIFRRGAAMILLSFVASTAYNERGIVYDEYHHLANESSQERVISDGAYRASGQSIMVHCMDKRAIDSNAYGGSSDARGFSVAGLTPQSFVFEVIPHAIDLSQNVCDGITDFAKQPHYDTNNPGDPKNRRIYKDADELYVLAHEMDHEQGQLIEGVANCHATQTVNEYAEAFGATKAEGDKIAIYEKPHTEDPKLPQYDIPAGCTPGGTWDLNPGHPGFFPYNLPEDSHVPIR